jgi:hypothetical protein
MWDTWHSVMISSQFIVFPWEHQLLIDGSIKLLTVNVEWTKSKVCLRHFSIPAVHVWHRFHGIITVLYTLPTAAKWIHLGNVVALLKKSCTVNLIFECPVIASMPSNTFSDVLVIYSTTSRTPFYRSTTGNPPLLVFSSIVDLSFCWFTCLTPNFFYLKTLKHCLL